MMLQLLQMVEFQLLSILVHALHSVVMCCNTSNLLSQLTTVNSRKLGVMGKDRDGQFLARN